MPAASLCYGSCGGRPWSYQLDATTPVAFLLGTRFQLQPRGRGLCPPPRPRPNGRGDPRPAPAHRARRERGAGRRPVTVASVLVMLLSASISRRSPVAERLARAPAGRRIESAGAPWSARACRRGCRRWPGPAGVDVSGPCRTARFTADLGAQFDLILVMEDAHRREKSAGSRRNCWARPC